VLEQWDKNSNILGGKDEDQGAAWRIGFQKRNGVQNPAQRDQRIIALRLCTAAVSAPLNHQPSHLPASSTAAQKNPSP
jgi:hypothetical protein